MSKNPETELETSIEDRGAEAKSADGDVSAEPELTVVPLDEDDVEVKSEDPTDEPATEELEEKAAPYIEIEDDEEEDELDEEEDEEEKDLDPKARRRAELLAELAALDDDDEKPQADPEMSPRARRLARMGMKSEEIAEIDDDAFLCAVERKMLKSEPCTFCRGGCAPEPDSNLPGLLDIEIAAEKQYDSEVLDSGYAPRDDLFVVDLKRADGSVIEAFYSGEGKSAGWLLLQDDLVEKKDALGGQRIISPDEAQEVATKTIEGKVLGVEADIFEGYDAYVVEIQDTDGKSFDAYVALDGTLLGYDEYITDAEEDTDPEVKSLAAEMELKRAYDKEKRAELAEEGKALPDGSFPIVDAEDLKNAIGAHARASDENEAKAHIMKRAVELGEEDMIPDEWISEKSEDDDTEVKEAPAVDSAFLKNLMEFELLAEELD